MENQEEQSQAFATEGLTTQGGEEESLVKQVGPQEEVKKPFLKVFLAILVVFFGVGTGYMLARQRASSENGLQRTQGGLLSDKGGVKKGEVFGVDNPEVYRDEAEGILQVNDRSLTDEGSHILIQEEGNPGRNANLTSTVLDLNDFVGRKVKVWGETFAAQKAGWLMDVGRLEVLE